MTLDPIIGRRLFVDGIVRPVFTDDAGHKYVIGSRGTNADFRRLFTGRHCQPCGLLQRLYPTTTMWWKSTPILSDREIVRDVRSFIGRWG
jgi:hypothetical protein